MFALAPAVLQSLKTFEKKKMRVFITLQYNMMAILCFVFCIIQVFR